MGTPGESKLARRQMPLKRFAIFWHYCRLPWDDGCPHLRLPVGRAPEPSSSAIVAGSGSTSLPGSKDAAIACTKGPSSNVFETLRGVNSTSALCRSWKTKRPVQIALILHRPPAGQSHLARRGSSLQFIRRSASLQPRVAGFSPVAATADPGNQPQA